MSDKKYYDLTFSQKVMYYTLRYSPKKNLMNICTSLWFKEEIDIDLLKKALLISLNRIDALNIHLTEINKNIKQYLSDEKYRDIEVLDYSDKSIEEIKQEFNKRACVEMKWKDCNLIDVVIAKVPENRVALCVVVNHVIADAWGLTVFMNDALEVYLSLREGKDLPEKPASFLKVIEEELKYTDSQKMKDDEEYWKSVFDEAPSYSSVNRKNVGKKYGRVGLDFTSTAKIIILPKEEVQVINDYCKKNRISPQVLYLLAMYCYLSMLNNKEHLLINNSLSRRSSIDVKRASGMMVNVIELFIKCKRSMTFEEACDSIAEVQLGAFKHGDYPYGNVIEFIKNKYVRGILKKGIIFADATLTYQLGKVKTEEPLDFDIMYHSNGASGMRLYLTIMDIADSGSLQFIYEYQIKALDEEDIINIHSFIIRIIKTGIKNPEMTLQQIIEEAEKNVYKKFLFENKKK